MSVYGLIHNRDDGSRLMRLPFGSLLYGTAAKGVEPCLGGRLSFYLR